MTFKSKGRYQVFRAGGKSPLAEFSTLAAAKSFAAADSPHALRWKKEVAIYDHAAGPVTTYYSDDYDIRVG